MEKVELMAIIAAKRVMDVQTSYLNWSANYPMFHN
jgi:hypothetical protein